MNAHEYQRSACEFYCTGAGPDRLPILNAACKEDPAKIGHHFNAVNLDIWDFDEQTKKKLPEVVKNFVQGDVLDMQFEDGHFGVVVLGEFLEHCTIPAARRALFECRRVLADEGYLALTFPLDDRAPEAQHGKHLLKIIVEGETGHDITVWHQTVWEDEMLEGLLDDTGPWKVIQRRPLGYGFIRGRRDPQGWGITLQKVSD